MAVNGGHAGTKKGPNWGHVIESEGRGMSLRRLGGGLAYGPGGHLCGRVGELNILATAALCAHKFGQTSGKKHV